MKKIIGLFLFCCLLQSCEKDKPQPKPNPEEQEGRKVLIANEGSLGNGNASLSAYNIDENQIRNNLFREANGEDLGDIFQSISLIDNQLYLVVNNSNKILVVDPVSYKLLHTISIRQPRHILDLGNHLALVSSFYFSKLYVLNTNTNEIVKEIPMPYPHLEGMVSIGQQAYICNWDTANHNIYVLDQQLLAITDSINIANKAPQSIVADKNNQLWVLSGNKEKNTPSALSLINPNTQTVVRNFTFPATADMIKLHINTAKDVLYFLGVNYDFQQSYNGLFRVGISDTSIGSTPFIAAQAYQYFYGIGIDPKTEHIYLSDPKGFIQKGDVYVYDPNGVKLQTFETELGPSNFYFMP